MRALTPVVRVRSRLLPVNVLDDEGKIVVRLQAEEPTALPASRPAEKLALRARLNVVGVRGYDGAYDRVLALLTGELGLTEASRPVHHEAIKATGGKPGGTSSKVKVALAPTSAPTPPP